MRTAIQLTLILLFPSIAASAADNTFQWEERSFFKRKVGTEVPPPQYYATTEEVPAGAEVRIRVVRGPEKASVAIHPFLGGPVFARGAVKTFSDLKADQTLDFKLADKMKIGLTTGIGDQPGECKGLAQKDGTAVLKYAVGDQELVLEVKIVMR